MKISLSSLFGTGCNALCSIAISILFVVMSANVNAQASAFDCNELTPLITSNITNGNLTVNANPGCGVLQSGNGCGNVIGNANDYYHRNALLGLTNTTVSVKHNNVVYSGDYFVGFNFQKGSILNLDILNLLGGVTIRTKLSNVTQETVSGSNGLTLLNVGLLGASRISAGFVATMDFDEIEIVISENLGLGVQHRVYFAFIQKFCASPNLPGDTSFLSCNIPTPAQLPDYPLYINPERTVETGLIDANLGAGGNDLQNLIDGNPNTSVNLASTASVGSTSSISVKNVLDTYQSGTFVGFEVEGNGALSVDLLGGVRIRTYLNNVLQETRTGSGDLLDVTTGLLYGGTGKRNIGFVATQDFDEVQISVSQLLSVQLASLDIYSLILTRGCQYALQCDEEIPLIQPNTPSFVNFERTGGGAACVGCQVNDALNVVQDTTDYAELITTVGVLNFSHLSVVDPVNTFPKGSFAGYVAQLDNGFISTGVLEFITITTYLRGIQQEVRSAGDLLNLHLLPILNNNTNKSAVGFFTTEEFDEIRISYGGLASALGDLRLYYPLVETSQASDGGLLNCCPTLVLKTGSPATQMQLMGEPLNTLEVSGNVFYEKGLSWVYSAASLSASDVYQSSVTVIDSTTIAGTTGESSFVPAPSLFTQSGMHYIYARLTEVPLGLSCRPMVEFTVNIVTAPEAYDSTMTDMFQPRLGNARSLSASVFTGSTTTPGAVLEEMKISTFPTRCEELIVNNISYTPSGGVNPLPGTGLIIPVQTNGNPIHTIEIIPVGVQPKVELSFTYIDDNNIESEEAVLEVNFYVANWDGSKWVHSDGSHGNLDPPSSNDTIDLFIICNDPDGNCTGSDTAIIDEDIVIRDLYIAKGAVLEIASVCLTVSGNIYYLDETAGEGFSAFSAINLGEVNISATTDENYGQYMGPELQNVTFEMPLEAGWHSISSPLSSSIADFVDINKNHPDANGKPIVNITGNATTQNVSWYTSEICGGYELGFQITRNLSAYGSHAYGTWQYDTAGIDMQASGFFIFLSQHFAPSFPHKLRVKGNTSASNHIYPTYNQWGGWNLIPNPYPISLDVNKMADPSIGGDFFADNMLDRAVYIFEPNDHRYIALDPDNGVIVDAALYLGVNASSVESLIAPFQSFYVRRTQSSQLRRAIDSTGNISNAPGASIAPNQIIDPALHDNTLVSGAPGEINSTVTIRPEYRSECGSVLHHRPSSNPEYIILTAVNKTNGIGDALEIAIDHLYNDSYMPGEDILKQFNTGAKAPNFFSIQEKRALVINRIVPPAKSKSIPLAMYLDDNTEVEIQAHKIPNNYYLILEDVQKGVFHSLNTNPYKFTNDVNSDMERFILHFGINLSTSDIDRSKQEPSIFANREGIHVQFGEVNKPKAKVEIYNLLGQTIYSNNSVDTQIEFTYGLEEGQPKTWIVIVEVDGKVFRKKVLR